MNRYRHSKSSLFLMEIMLNMLFFSILVAFCLQIFVKAHRISEDTSTLHRAVTICSSVAEICQSTENAVELLSVLYPDAAIRGQDITIYFDRTFSPCCEYDAVYQACVTLADDALQASEILFLKTDTTDTIYTLSFCTYTPASLSELGGRLHE